MLLSEICIRDPFVLLEGDTYYMYGTRSSTAWTNADGFDVYKSTDLKNWSGAKEIFHNHGQFWASHSYWAPECIKYKGSYYLIATFGGKGRKKGIQFLKSNSPEGIFTPVSQMPVTPEDWECLDGTFYEGENGSPYLIFSHGIPEIPRGALCAAKLKDDFTGFEGEPKVLFYADEAEWTRPIPFAKKEFGIEGPAYFSDGPYIIKKDRKISLLWSSWSNSGYAMGLSALEGDLFNGSWQHGRQPFVRGGGHGMVFKDKNERMILTYHSPNDRLKEHPVFRPLESLT